MVYFLPTTSTYPDWMSNMWDHMGGMMGGGGGTSEPYFLYFGIIFAVVIGILLVGVVGLVYYFVVPEIKSPKNMIENKNKFTSEDSSAFDSVLKTLNDDEKKVLLILRKHNGKYLQKYIRDEANLSRLKIHRILARFNDRGIVALQKTGNTNEVRLAEWLK